MKINYAFAWRVMTNIIPQWVQLLILIPLAAALVVTCIFSLMGSEKSAVFSSLVGVFIWWGLSASCLAAAHQAHQLSIPEIKKYSVAALIFLYFLLIVLPALCSNQFIYTLAFGTLCAVVAMIVTTSPYWVLLLWIPNEIRKKLFPQMGVSVHIDITNLFMFGALLFLLSALFAFNWRRLLHKPFGQSSSVTMLEGWTMNSSSRGTKMGDQLNTLGAPRFKKHASVRGLNKIRTLLGMSYAPRAWRTAAISMAIFVSLYVWISYKSQDSWPMIVSMVFFYFGIYSVRYWVITHSSNPYGPAKHELALLPGLPEKQVHWLVAALATSLSLEGIAFSAIFLVLMAYLHHLAMLWPVFLIGGVFLSVMMGIIGWLTFAHSSNQPLAHVVTLLAAVAFQVVTLLAWLAVLDNWLGAGDHSEGWVLVLVINVCLLIGAYMWSSRKIKALPHPYLTN